jgi:colicin import membrane protein/protein TonB
VSIPVASALGQRERIWPAVLVSCAVHAVAIGWAVTQSGGPSIDLEQKPIKARLVRLGERKPEKLLPRKQEPPPPAPAPAPAPAIPAATAPVRAPAAAPTPRAARPPPPRPAPASPSSAGAGLASALSRMQREVERERWGDPEGDPLGDSEDAGEGDRYLALVIRALQGNYDVPNTISERERLHLKSTIVLFIEPDGRVARWRVERPSGNVAFDAALERTIRQTRLPPPPDDKRETYRSNGVEVIFQI